jgi:hypothetical protein
MYHESDNTHGRAYIPIFVCSARRVAGRASGASRVMESGLEEWVWERVSNALRHPELIAAELERRRAAGPDETLTERLKIAKREYKKRHDKQEQLREQWKTSDDDSFSLEMLQRIATELEHEKEGFLKAIAEIEGRIADQQQSTFQLERLVEYCARASQNLDSFTFERKVMAFQALQVRVTANGEDWHIDGSIPLQMDGDAFPVLQTLSEQR